MINVTRIKGYVLRHLYEIGASIDRKADIVFFPIIDLLVFGFLTVYINKLNYRFGLAGMILGGIIFWTLIYNIQRDMSFSLLEDAWSRNLYNLFASPLTIGEVIVGTLILSVLKVLITVAVILFLAWGLFHFDIFQYGPMIGFFVFNLFLFGWAFGYMTASLIFRFGTKVQAVAWSLVLVIYPLSGVFYPISILPKALIIVARFLPISYIFEGLRSMISSGRGPDFGVLILIFALNLIYLGGGIWLFVMGFRNAKNRGWFIHPS